MALFKIFAKNFLAYNCGDWALRYNNIEIIAFKVAPPPKRPHDVLEKFADHKDFKLLAPTINPPMRSRMAVTLPCPQTPPGL